MRVKIIKPSRWTMGKRDIVAFAMDQVLSVPEDIPQKTADDMLTHGYAVLAEGSVTDPDQSGLSSEVKADAQALKAGAAPKNKAVNAPENKVRDIPNLDEMTRKELVTYAQSKGIEVKMLDSKKDIIKKIKTGGK